tara:strand:+ start:1402 stop:1818 length:417 start_codon:yes stop_codon:yes gene_type:complete
MKKVDFKSSRAPKPVGFYPHAKKVGSFLFLSGVGPRSVIDNSVPGVVLNENGGLVDYNFEKQCVAVFENVRFVLDEAGSSWENIVDVTVFLTNMKDDFKKFNLLYKKYFESCFPCRTTVEVNCLPTPIAIELKVIATI